MCSIKEVNECVERERGKRVDETRMKSKDQDIVWYYHQPNHKEVTECSLQKNKKTKTKTKKKDPNPPQDSNPPKTPL